MFEFFASLIISIVLGEIAFALAKKPEPRIGPRLDSLKVQVSSYGAPVPQVWGTMRLSGNIIWATDLVERVLVYEVTVSRSLLGQKKKQTVIEYRYFANLASAFCEGPVAGFRKIWFNDKVVVDLSDTNTGPTGANTNIRMYKGSETQAPDPLIIGVEGATATPAFRGTAYIVFEMLPLEEYGNGLPNISAEIVDAEGTISGWRESVSTFVGGFVLTPWHIVHAGSSFLDWMDRYTGDLQYSKAQIGSSVPGSTSGDPSRYNYDPSRNAIWLTGISLIDPATGAQFTGAYAIDALTGAFIGGSGTSGGGQVKRSWYVPGYDKMIWWQTNVTDDLTYATILDCSTKQYVQFPAVSGQIGSVTGEGDIRFANALSWVAQPPVVGGYSGPVVYDVTPQIPAEWWGVEGKYIRIINVEEMRLDATIQREYWMYAPCYDAVNDWMWVVKGNSTHTGTTDTIEAWDCKTRSIVKTLTVGTAGAVGAFGLAFDPDGFLWVCNPNGPTIYGFSLTTFAVAQTITPGATLQGWSGSFKVMVVEGRLVYPTGASSYMTVLPLQDRYAAAGVPLDDVVSDLCIRSGLIGSDFNVTALESDTVHGYVLTGQTSARKAIEELQVPYLFDAVENGALIKFVKRGGASVASIPFADMVAGGNTTITTLSRAAEKDLPVEVTFTALDRARDYANHTQYARRLTRRSEQKLNIELPLVFTPDQGAQMTDVLLANFWRERTSYRFNLGPKWWVLEPTDVVDVVDVSGSTHRVRLTRTDIGANGVMACEAVMEDATQYTSTARGVDGGNDPGVVRTLRPTVTEIVDLPAISWNDATDAAVTVGAASTGYWPGADLYISWDGGATFGLYGTVAARAKIGATTSIHTDPQLSEGRTDILDWSQTVNVSMPSPTEDVLSSVTWAELMEGRFTNLAIIGSEIIKFKVATYNSGNNTYALSGLLRGLYGTAWAMSSHVSGERFMLLEPETLTRITYASTLSGAVAVSQTQTLGLPPTARVGDAVTLGAVALECIAPAHVGGGRKSGSGADWELKCRRSDRRGAAWIDYSDAPQSESSLAFDIEILTADFATVKRTVTDNASEAYTYTSANQTTDWGTGGAKLFGVRWYQKSALVGRGYAGQAVMTTPVVASFLDDVAYHAAGENPPTGYTKKGDTGNYTAEVVLDTRSDRNRRAIKISSADTLSKDMVLSWDGPSTSTDCELVGLFNFSGNGDSLSNAYGIGPAVRISGADGALNYYSLRLDVWGKNQIELWKSVSGSRTFLARYTPFTLSASNLYWLRLRAMGSLVQGKVWAQGSDEPATWQINVTDTGVTAAGLFGIAARDTIPDYYCYYLHGMTY